MYQQFASKAFPCRFRQDCARNLPGWKHGMNGIAHEPDLFISECRLSISRYVRSPVALRLRARPSLEDVYVVAISSA